VNRVSGAGRTLGYKMLQKECVDFDISLFLQSFQCQQPLGTHVVILVWSEHVCPYPIICVGSPRGVKSGTYLFVLVPGPLLRE